MDNEFDGLDEFDDDETYETVTMTDETGKETDFFVIDAIELDKHKYILVVAAEDFDNDEPEAVILKETVTKGEDAIYELVEDENEYNKVIIMLQDNDSDYEVQF